MSDNIYQFDAEMFTDYRSEDTNYYADDNDNVGV